MAFLDRFGHLLAFLAVALVALLAWKFGAPAEITGPLALALSALVVQAAKNSSPPPPSSGATGAGVAGMIAMLAALVAVLAVACGGSESNRPMSAHDACELAKTAVSAACAIGQATAPDSPETRDACKAADVMAPYVVYVGPDGGPAVEVNEAGP